MLTTSQMIDRLVNEGIELKLLIRELTFERDVLKANHDALRRIASHVPALVDTGMKGPLAKLVLARCDRSYGRRKTRLGADLVIRGATAEDVVRAAAFVCLYSEVDEWRAHEEFPKRARAFGVDVNKLLPPLKPEAKEGDTKTKKKAGTRKPHA